jgi:hypothetical protein
MSYLYGGCRVAAGQNSLIKGGAVTTLKNRLAACVLLHHNCCFSMF